MDSPGSFLLSQVFAQTIADVFWKPKLAMLGWFFQALDALHGRGTFAGHSLKDFGLDVYIDL